MPALQVVKCCSRRQTPLGGGSECYENLFSTSAILLTLAADLINDLADPLQRSLTSMELADVLIGAPPAGASATFPPASGAPTRLLACSHTLPFSRPAARQVMASPRARNAAGGPIAAADLPHPSPRLACVQGRWRRRAGATRRLRCPCARSWLTWWIASLGGCRPPRTQVQPCLLLHSYTSG